jgi:hypothetical protein
MHAEFEIITAIMYGIVVLHLLFYGFHHTILYIPYKWVTTKIGALCLGLAVFNLIAYIIETEEAGKEIAK